jgi:putative pyruvate formate lyase activating enzyme
MSQYTPMPHILADGRFPELEQKVDKEEYERLVDFAVKIGIENAFIQEGEVASESFIPAFDGEGL